MDGWSGYKEKNISNLTLHDNDLPKKHGVDEKWMNGDAIKHKSWDLTLYDDDLPKKHLNGWKMDEHRGTIQQTKVVT